MNKDEILKALGELSAEDQRAVREQISERAAASCCSTAEMQTHMGAMMKMMSSSENPTEHCNQMMEMCQKMMAQKMGSKGEEEPHHA